MTALGDGNSASVLYQQKRVKAAVVLVVLLVLQYQTTLHLGGKMVSEKKSVNVPFLAFMSVKNDVESRLMSLKCHKISPRSAVGE